MDDDQQDSSIESKPMFDEKIEMTPMFKIEAARH
jgi:hypothetical protein